MGCVVEGCGKVTDKGHRVCSMHKARMRRTGGYGPPGLLRAPNGAGCLKQDGYRYRYVDGRYLYEHVAAMEQHIGRRLLPTEQVHHKNGVRHDNRLENLELWSVRHPAGQRVEDMIAFAAEMLATYAPHLLSEEGRMHRPLSEFVWEPDGSQVGS